MYCCTSSPSKVLNSCPIPTMETWEKGNTHEGSLRDTNIRTRKARQ
jgi:hypothetical protein